MLRLDKYRRDATPSLATWSPSGWPEQIEACTMLSPMVSCPSIRVGRKLSVVTSGFNVVCNGY